MTTNSLLPSTPEWIDLTISLPREVASFRELSGLAKGLDDVDRLLLRLAPDAWPAEVPSLRRRAILQRFRVDSPPVFDVLTNPAWLTLFVAVIAGYKPAKDGLREMMSDASALLDKIDGITQEQVSTLKMGVRLMVERMLQASEDGALQLAKKVHLARSRLLGREGGQVTIVVREYRKNLGH